MGKVRIDNWLTLGITFSIWALTHLLILTKHLKNFQKLESEPQNWIICKIGDEPLQIFKWFQSISAVVVLTGYTLFCGILQFLFVADLCNQFSEMKTLTIDDFFEEKLWLIWIVLPVFVLMLYFWFGPPASPKTKDVIALVIFISMVQ